MTPQEKVAEADRRLADVMNGHVDVLACPFCNEATVVGDGPLCCMAMAEVATAKVKHVEAMQAMEMAGRAMDRFLSMN